MMGSLASILLYKWWKSETKTFGSNKKHQLTTAEKCNSYTQFSAALLGTSRGKVLIFTKTSSPIQYYQTTQKT